MLPCAAGPDPWAAAARAEERGEEQPARRGAEQRARSHRAWHGSICLKLTPHLLFASARGKISREQQVRLYSVKCLSEKENRVKTLHWTTNYPELI